MIPCPSSRRWPRCFPPTVSAEDVRSYVNVNLSRLERFVEREIYFRETADQVVPDSITKEEVIDETIAAALGGDGKSASEKPERLALEPWLYRLALTRSTNSPAPMEATAAPYTWKIRAQAECQGQRRARTAIPSA